MYARDWTVLLSGEVHKYMECQIRYVNGGIREIRLNPDEIFDMLESDENIEKISFAGKKPSSRVVIYSGGEWQYRTLENPSGVRD